MNFNLTDVNGTSNSQPRLKPWEIHDVVFKGVTYNQFSGKKDPNAVYKTMRVRFENKDGYYEETVWCPKEGDEVRQVNDNGRENPSNLERFKFFLAHLGEQLSPEKYAKFKGQSWNLPEDFEKLVTTFAAAMKPAEGKETKLKLIGTKKGEPCLPYFVNVSKEGAAYISNNFLGGKAFFSPYELETMEKYKNAKPTDMSKKPVDDLGVDGEASDTNSDLDFEV